MQDGAERTAASAHRPLLLDVVRHDATSRVAFTIDGTPAEARKGRSILAAMLLAGDFLRTNEFSGEPRAGFCLMGACQDCWVWLADCTRVRACTTPVAEGMAIFTAPPPGFPGPGTPDHG